MSDQTGDLVRLLDERGVDLHALLVRLTLREDAADDLLQDLFLRLATSEGFAAARHPYAFARTTAIRLAFDWRRSNRLRQADSLCSEPPGSWPTPLEDVAELDEFERVLVAMEQLPATDGEIITMRYLEQASYDEIAGHLELTPHQARARCAKAMKRLRSALDVESSGKKVEAPRVEP